MTARKNLGMAGRVARIIIGIIFLMIIPLAFFGPKTPLAYLGFMGIIPLIAGVTGFCLPFALLGIDTYRKKETVKQ